MRPLEFHKGFPALAHLQERALSVPCTEEAKASGMVALPLETHAHICLRRIHLKKASAFNVVRLYCFSTLVIT